MTFTSVSKKRVLTIAYKAFAKHGYKALTMRLLATKCGMTVSSLYHHFPSKEALYDEVLDDIYKDNSKYWQDPIESKGDNWEEQLKNYISNFCHIIHREPDFTQLMKREQLDADPKRMEKLAASVLTTEYIGFEALIKKANPNCDARIYVMTILGMALHYYETNQFRCYLPDYSEEMENPELVAEQITNILIGGITYRGDN